MADTLNSRQIIQKPDILIDPNFATPPGVADARLDPNLSTRRLNEDGVTAEVVLIDETGSPGGAGELIAPGGLMIESQRQSQNPDGTFAVDATLVFSDVPGALRYEVRLTKA